MSKSERFHDDYAIPLQFYVGSGEIGGNEVIVVDLRLVVPMAPELGEQRAVLVLDSADAATLAADLERAAASVPTIQNQNQTPADAGEEESN